MVQRRVKLLPELRPTISLNDWRGQCEAYGNLTPTQCRTMSDGGTVCRLQYRPPHLPGWQKLEELTGRKRQNIALHIKAALRKHWLVQDQCAHTGQRAEYSLMTPELYAKWEAESRAARTRECSEIVPQ